MNSTQQNGVDSLHAPDPYKIYQLQLIRLYYSEAAVSLEIGRDLKALGYSLQDWHEANARLVDQIILSKYWESFLGKTRAEALHHLNLYIQRYFPEAEDRMGKAMEAEDRASGLLLAEA